MRLFDPGDVATLRPWLLDHVCPFWLERIIDPAGGFFEELDSLGSAVTRPRRTTLVQARLTYVFSHAYLLNGDPAFGEAARHGVAFLMRAARAPDGGWFRAVSVEGATLDNARDTYDHAFVLFALAWYFRATNDASAIQLADATWQSMQERLADPRHGGFFEEFAPGRGAMKLPRRQNPHMHLLEAMLALHAATGEKNWLRRATALVDLFKRRFVDPQTGALIEFFAEDWTVAPAAEGALREPGHQFEWVWLLHEYYRLSRDDSVTSTRSACSPSARHSASSAAGELAARCSTARRRRGRARCRHQAAVAADRIPQGLRGACRMVRRHGGARCDRDASRADRQALHAPGRRDLAQPARPRRQAAHAGDAGARALPPVHGGSLKWTGCSRRPKRATKAPRAPSGNN